MRKKRDHQTDLKSNQGLPSSSIAVALMIKLICASVAYGGTTATRERLLPAGNYMPFFKTAQLRKPKSVRAFWLDTHPVTNQEYLNFVRDNPEWRRSSIARVFADDSYLKNWRSDLKLGSPLERRHPVTQVSWFAASAFCHAQGKELPTTDQWEYAAEDAGRNTENVKNKILSWYSVPNTKTLGALKKNPANGYGIHDLHGLIWEWTLDFNSAMIGSELRGDGTKDDNLFCGAGTLNALNPSDYAKFMRYSFRNSLQADYTTVNLGFRCAREKSNEAHSNF